jgi:hypothetical protein
MVDVTTILLAIIFIIIIAIIIVTLLYFNRNIPAVALITNFGLTIQNVNTGLYMSIENINTSTSPTILNAFPIITLKSLAPEQSPEPTEGWLLDRPTDAPTSTTVTFFNPSNGGYINYNVNLDGTSLNPNYISVDRSSIPSNPTGGTGSIYWFDIQQTLVGRNTITTFKSLYPGQLNGQDQFLIPGTVGISPNNPNVFPVTIGVPSNNNHYWIVG